MKTELSRWSPPGMDIRPYKQLFIWGSVFSLIYSFGFLTRLSGYISALYHSVAGKRVLLEGAVMPNFRLVMGSAAAGFFILALCMLLMIIPRYLSFRQGSRSIYLMKRLPDRWDMHRRCVIMQLLLAALCAAMAVALTLIYFGIYMLAVPEECLQPDQWRKLWSVSL